jgi:P-type E1-E2 ATPase
MCPYASLSRPSQDAIILARTMIELDIPGRGLIRLEHLVSDVNGTLAVDGRLMDGVATRLTALGDRLQLHLLTADTHGRQGSIDQQLGLTAIRVPAEAGDLAKADYVEKLGAATVAALGQGANDAAMLKAASIGIAVLSVEGASGEALAAADVVVPDILSALALFERPMRLVATLRR